MCLYILRHGLTNEDLPDNDRVSGWSEIPLNAEGRINAHRAARRLKGLCITSITSSDTKRAAQTAKIVSEHTGIPVVESEALRSWNMGSLQGMLHETANPFLEFFEKNPDIKVPKGEPFRVFYNRFKRAFDAMVAYTKRFPNAAPLVVTHSQNLDMIPWYIKGIPPGKELEFGNGMKPGSILEVRFVNGELKTRKVGV